MGAILIIVVILIIVIIVLSNSEVKKKKTDYYTAAQFSLEREKSRRPNEYIYKEKSQNVSFDISFEKSTKSVGKYLIIDCETTGMPISQNASIHTLNNWPRIVQLAWFVFDIEKKLLKSYSSIINPGVEIPQQAVSIHKITTARVKKRVSILLKS